MKTTVKLSVLIGLVLLVLCLCLTACGQDPSTDEGQTTGQGAEQNATQLGELAFELNEAGDGYVVTGIGTFTDTELVIPATYENLPVKSIKKEAFKNCTQLTVIELPDGILIDEYAFAGCTGLKQVTVPQDAACKNGAFADCTGLESATLYSNNGEGMFENCTALKHLTFGADTHIDANYKTLGKIAWTVTNYEDIPDGAWDYDQVYETDENGETVYETDEYGEQVAKVSHYIVREYLGIESVSGGILNFQSDLMGLPKLTSVENYTIEGEHYWIDGVLIGDSKLSYEDEDPTNDGPYSILWVSPQLETLNMKELAPYFPWIMAQKSIIERYAAYPMVKTIYLHAEFNELINNRFDFTPSDSVTDIYYMGMVVEWLDNMGTYYGDTCTIHCTDGDISKELGAVITSNIYKVNNYKWINYNAFMTDMEQLAEYKAEYDALLYLKSAEEYESYNEYSNAANDSEDYALYQEYLAYRTAKSRFETSRNRRLNDVVNMYSCYRKIEELNLDVETAANTFLNVNLPILENAYGCTVEYEQSKQGDLTAVTNADQLPQKIREYVQLFASLQDESIPKTPAEAKALYEQAAAALIDSGYITQEELNNRITPTE